MDPRVILIGMAACVAILMLASWVIKDGRRREGIGLHERIIGYSFIAMGSLGLLMFALLLLAIALGIPLEDK